jgi:hypothetical protein
MMKPATHAGHDEKRNQPRESGVSSKSPCKTPPVLSCSRVRQNASFSLASPHSGKCGYSRIAAGQSIGMIPVTQFRIALGWIALGSGSRGSATRSGLESKIVLNVSEIDVFTVACIAHETAGEEV